MQEKWAEISIHTTQEATEAVAAVFHELGAGGVVIEDPDLIQSYRSSGNWTALVNNANAGAGIEIVQFNPKVMVYDVYGSPGSTAQISYFDPDAKVQIQQLGAGLDDDLLAPFLAIARSAAEGLSGPDDEELGRVYGTNSPGRIRRLLEHLEKKGLLVVREDFGGGRTLIVPGISASVDG